MKVFVLGYPSDIGGANTELWHTLKLWRANGVDVTLIPTWDATADQRQRVESLGCRTVLSSFGHLREVDGLAGSIIVGFCNQQFLNLGAALKRMGCRTVWVPCMCFPLHGEPAMYAMHGLFDVHVFQSEYQRSCAAIWLTEFGWRPEQSPIIPGAFDVYEFPLDPKPHRLGEPFIIGKLARARSGDGIPARDKYPFDLWQQYERIPYPRIHARVMGWSPELAAQCGRPPAWVMALNQGAESSRSFLSNVHCLVPGIGATPENCPRVGLEAMAAGVPIVAPRLGGWCEMIDHGRTGYLADDAAHQAYLVACLAWNEQRRLTMIEAARYAVHDRCKPSAAWAKWKAVFRRLGGE